MDAGDHIHVGVVWNAPALGTKSLTVWLRHIWVSTKHANHIHLERPFSQYASLQQPTNCFASFQTFLPHSITTASTSARSTLLSLSTNYLTMCDNSWKVSKRAKKLYKGRGGKISSVNAIKVLVTMCDMTHKPLYFNKKLELEGNSHKMMEIIVLIVDKHV